MRGMLVPVEETVTTGGNQGGAEGVAAVTVAMALLVPLLAHAQIVPGGGNAPKVIFCAFAIVSVAQGAGWRPALAGMPLYAIIFFCDHVYLGKGNNQIAQEKPGERRRYIIMMLQAIEQAVSGASRRRRFFLHIATVLVLASMFRGNNWQAILFKLAMLAAGYLIVFLFELWKGWRAVTGKAPLGSAPLWKNFFISACR